MRNEIGVGFGEAGGNRGEDTGANRGEPPIGRYLGVADPVVGLNKGDDGRDRTPPEPLTPGLLSSTDKKARELDELCRAWTAPVRFVGGGFSRSTALGG